MVFETESTSYEVFKFFSDYLPAIVMMIPSVCVVVVLMPWLVLSLTFVFCNGCFEKAVHCCHTLFCCRLCCEEGECFVKYYVWITKLLHFSARGIFKMKSSQGDSDESPKTEFLGYVVPNYFLFQVFSVTGMVAGYAAFSFTNVFFVAESSTCDATNSDLACFTSNASSNMTERVNCSTLESTFNGTAPDLECYEFVFSTSEAISAAGGILTMGAVLFAVPTGLLLYISKGNEASLCRAIIALSTQLCLSLAALAVLYILPFLGGYDDSAGSFSTFFEYLVVFFMIIIGLGVPWWRFERVPRERGRVNVIVNFPPEAIPGSSSSTGPPPDAHEGRPLVPDKREDNYQTIA